MAATYLTHFQINEEGAEYKVYIFCSESTYYLFMSDHKDLILFQSASQSIENIELESHKILDIDTKSGTWIITYESNVWDDTVTLTIPDNQDVVTYFRGVEILFNPDMHEPLAPRIRF